MPSVAVYHRAAKHTGHFISALARLTTRTLNEGESGVTTVLVGFLASAGILASTVVGSGELSSAQFEQIFHESLGRVGGTVVLQGSVVATASGTPLAVDTVQLTVGMIGRTDPVSFDRGSSGPRVIVSYQDSTLFLADVPYSVEPLSGDGDLFLSAGEVFTLKIHLDQVAGSRPALGPGKSWRIEVNAPSGGPLDISRTMPASLDPVMLLR